MIDIKRALSGFVYSRNPHWRPWKETAGREKDEPGLKILYALKESTTEIEE